MDAFDVLQVAPRFVIDVTELEARYRELQRRFHPDKFVNAPAAERRESLTRAVSINEAFRQLRDDLKRAELLLARAGRRTSAQETAAPELLMEVMDLREQLADARATRDLKAARLLATEVSAREQAQHAVLAHILDGAEEARTVPKLEAAAQALGRLRYYRRFQDEVALLEDEASE